MKGLLRLLRLLVHVALLRYAVLVNVMNSKTPFAHQQLGTIINHKLTERLIALAIICDANCKVVAELVRHHGVQI